MRLKMLDLVQLKLIKNQMYVIWFFLLIKIKLHKNICAWLLL